ncbi:MAG TPA: hypothetical protein VFN03_13070 [Trueperaceae bacterium]|nr:hypothetical protein [Trueperaceae bacterium]
MTRDLTISARPTASASAARLVTTARWLFGRLVNIGKWFVAIAAVGFVLVPPLVNAFGGRLEISIWEMFATNGPGWFSLAMGATLVANYLTVVVAQGVTRGRYALASALAIVVFAALLAVFVWLGYVLEATYFRQFEWTHALLGEHLFTNVSQVLQVTVEYAARHTLFAFVGLIVGYGYYRVGGVWGTILLPLTLVLPLAAGIVILGLPGMTALLTFGGIVGATPTGALLLLPYFVLLIIAGRYLLSTVPIRTKTG